MNVVRSPWRALSLVMLASVCIGAVCAAVPAMTTPVTADGSIPRRLTAEDVINESKKRVDSASAPSRLGFGDASELQALANLSWTADSSSLMVDVADDPTGLVRRIEQIDIVSGDHRRLGLGRRPLASPNGEWVAFVRDAVDGSELWVMRADGAYARRVLPEKFRGRQAGNAANFQRTGATTEELAQFTWSPDSRSLLFERGTDEFGLKPEEEERIAHAKRSENAEETTAQEFGMVFPHPRWPRNSRGTLSVVDLVTGRTRVIAQGRFLRRGMGPLAWLRDGRVLYSRKIIPPDGVGGLGTYANAELRLLSIRGGHDRLLDGDPFVDLKMMAVSHDQTWVAYDDHPGPFGNACRPLAIATLAGSKPRSDKQVLFPDATGIRRIIGWSADNRGLYVVANDLDSNVEYRGLDGSRRVLPSLSPDIVLSPDGRNVAWLALGRAGASTQIELRTGTLDNGHSLRDERILRSFAGTLPGRRNTRNELGFESDIEAAELAKRFHLVTHRRITWRSHDGLELRGYLLLPLDYAPGQRYPLLVDVHGGPGHIETQYGKGPLLYNTPLEKQLWATKGYVVFTPDYRSSGIYGLGVLRRAWERGSLQDDELKDVMSGVDAVIAMGIVDTTRMAVAGHSYGGNVVNWIITHTDRFRAAISYEGESIAYMSWGSKPGRDANIYYDMYVGKPPYEAPDQYRRISASTYVRNVTTPTLFVSGDRNLHTVPPEQNAWMYTALRTMGVDTRYVVYWGEGHGNDRPANRLDLLRRSINWIDGHLEVTSKRVAH